MKFLVVAATKMEVAGFVDFLNKISRNAQNQFDFLITGAGMVPTTFALSVYLNNLRQQSTAASSDELMILNAGIAGAFDRSISLGSLVNVMKDTFSEFGAEDNDDFISIDELGFAKSTYFSADTNTLLNNIPSCTKLNAVEGITVNCAHGNKESIERVLAWYPTAQTESMEGAAVFYVAEQFGVPAAQIRSISNYVEPRARNNWKIQEAIQELNAWLIQFVESKIQ